MSVSMFLLPLLLVVVAIIPVTARLNSVQVISFRRLRKTKNGQVMCALDAANETISSSSQQQCSFKCAKDATCTGFNLKNSATCDVYNYRPKITILVPACKFDEVATVYHVCITLPDITHAILSVTVDCCCSASEYSLLESWSRAQTLYAIIERG